MLMNRKVRDANFRRAVCRAYDDRCAVTGLKIVNGGGRSEVQAAHIRSVADGGPDIVQKGIALSATAHWLFDRHLISIGEDMWLLVSHNKVRPSCDSFSRLRRRAFFFRRTHACGRVLHSSRPTANGSVVSSPAERPTGNMAKLWLSPARSCLYAYTS
jgi:HNH endonuclease